MKMGRLALAVCLSCIVTVVGSLSAYADSADSVTGSVTVGSTGIFDARFCNGYQEDGSAYVCSPVTTLTFPNSDVGINQSTTSSTSISICFTDTKTSRGAFTASVQASDFTSGGNTIPASAVTPTSLRWATAGRQGIGVGTIGAFDGSADRTDYQTDFDWSGGDLSQSRKVAYGLSGGGTAATVSGGRFLPGTVITIALTLTVPAGTQPGTYTSTFTLDVTPDAP